MNSESVIVEEKGIKKIDNIKRLRLLREFATIFESERSCRIKRLDAGERLGILGSYELIYTTENSEYMYTIKIDKNENLTIDFEYCSEESKLHKAHKESLLRDVFETAREIWWLRNVFV